MQSHTIKTWAWLHKWSSLVCTVFMLLLCLTGLPLIFHHEIGHLLGTEVEAPPMPQGTPHASLDKVLEVARAQHPDRVVQFVSKSDDTDDLWFVTMTPTPAPTDDFRSVVIDARTAELLAQPRFDQGFMWVMFKLHVDLFAGLPGKLFLGFMGLLLLMHTGRIRLFGQAAEALFVQYVDRLVERFDPATAAAGTPQRDLFAD